jgi:hypothetical protein
MLTRRSLIKALGALTPGYWLGKGRKVELPVGTGPKADVFGGAPILASPESEPVDLVEALEGVYRRGITAARQFHFTVAGALHYDVRRLVSTEWRRMVEGEGLKLLPTDEHFYANRDRLYDEHDDKVRGHRVLSCHHSFDIDEVGDARRQVTEFPVMVAPTAVVPVDHAPEGGRCLWNNSLRGDPAAEFARTVDGSLKSMLEQVRRQPVVLAVGDAGIYMHCEHFMFEFFTYASLWLPGPRPS